MFPFALIGLVIGVGSELLFGNEIKEREESGKKSYKIAKDCYDKKMFFDFVYEKALNEESLGADKKRELKVSIDSLIS